MTSQNLATKVISVPKCSMVGNLIEGKSFQFKVLENDERITEKHYVWYKSGTYYLMFDGNCNWLFKPELKTPGIALRSTYVNADGTRTSCVSDGIYDLTTAYKSDEDLYVKDIPHTEYFTKADFAERVRVGRGQPTLSGNVIHNKDKECSTLDCTKPAYCKGFCTKCYTASRKDISASKGNAETKENPIILDVNLTTDRCEPNGTHTIIIDKQFEYLTKGKALFNIMPNGSLMAIMSPDGFYYQRPGKQFAVSFASLMYGRYHMQRFDIKDTEDYQLSCFKPGTGKIKPILIVDVACRELTVKDANNEIVDILWTEGFSTLNQKQTLHIINNLDGENKQHRNFEHELAKRLKDIQTELDNQEPGMEEPESDESEEWSVSDGSDSNDGTDETESTDSDVSLAQMKQLLVQHKCVRSAVIAKMDEEAIRRLFAESFDESESDSDMSADSSDDNSSDESELPGTELAKAKRLQEEEEQFDIIDNDSLAPNEHSDCFKEIHNICFTRKQAFTYATSSIDISEFMVIHGMPFSLFELRAMLIEAHD